MVKLRKWEQSKSKKKVDREKGEGHTPLLFYFRYHVNAVKFVMI